MQSKEEWAATIAAAALLSGGAAALAIAVAGAIAGGNGISPIGAKLVAGYAIGCQFLAYTVGARAWMRSASCVVMVLRLRARTASGNGSDLSVLRKGQAASALIRRRCKGDPGNDLAARTYLDGLLNGFEAIGRAATRPARIEAPFHSTWTPARLQRLREIAHRDGAALRRRVEARQ